MRAERVCNVIFCDDGVRLYYFFVCQRASEISRVELAVRCVYPYLYFTSRLAPPIKHDDCEDGIGESASETRIQAIRDRTHAHTHAYE